jgi:hypothetical protein
LIADGKMSGPPSQWPPRQTKPLRRARNEAVGKMGNAPNEPKEPCPAPNEPIGKIGKAPNEAIDKIGKVPNEAKQPGPAPNEANCSAPRNLDRYDTKCT